MNKAKEREAFEAWFAGWHDPNVGLIEAQVERAAAWDAWQARAAAGPHSAAAAQPVAALRQAEAALSDIGDADREPGDDVAWCERRAAEPLPVIRAALALPVELFDGHAVYRALTKQAQIRTSHENVSDTLDALARVMRRTVAPEPGNTEGRSGGRTNDARASGDRSPSPDTAGVDRRHGQETQEIRALPAPNVAPPAAPEPATCERCGGAGTVSTAAPEHQRTPLV
jgi:hypothetical protein